MRSRAGAHIVMGEPGASALEREPASPAEAVGPARAGEGVKVKSPFPSSLSHINIFILHFHFFYSKSVGTLLSPSPFTILRVGQVPQN
jgi:hypothetical protein